MKNKLIDLNNALFEQLERVQNPDDKDKLDEELDKARAMNEIAKSIIDIHKLVYRSAQEKGRELDYLDYQFNGGIKALEGNRE